MNTEKINKLVHSIKDFKSFIINHYSDSELSYLADTGDRSEFAFQINLSDDIPYFLACFSKKNKLDVKDLIKDSDLNELFKLFEKYFEIAISDKQKNLRDLQDEIDDLYKERDERKIEIDVLRNTNKYLERFNQSKITDIDYKNIFFNKERNKLDMLLDESNDFNETLSHMKKEILKNLSSINSKLDNNIFVKNNKKQKEVKFEYDEHKDYSLNTPQINRLAFYVLTKKDVFVQFKEEAFPNAIINNLEIKDKIAELLGYCRMQGTHQELPSKIKKFAPGYYEEGIIEILKK